MVTIELRNIKYSAFASEETHCYTATLYVDGVKLGEVSNQGHGGGDMFHPAPGKSWDDYKAADARCAAELPPSDLTSLGMPGQTMPQSIETVCCDLVNDFLTARDLKRMLGRSLAFFKEAPTGKGAPLYTVALKKGAPVERIAALMQEKHPGAVILNGKPEAEALALFRLAA